MDIEKTINHEKFDLVDIKDLRSIPHHWKETQLDFIRSSDSITDNYEHLINLFSDAIDQIVACYCRYRNGKTSDLQNRIERIKGLFKTQDPYLLNWLNAESVRGYDHYNYLKYLGHNFELVFINIGIDLTETGIPSIINEYLKLKTKPIEDENRNRNEFDKQKPAPYTTLGRFCQLVSLSGLLRQGTDTQEDFTKKVCNKYGFDWNDKIRQAFSQSQPKRHDKRIETKILPLLDSDSSNKILEYLNNTGKLYQ